MKAIILTMCLAACGSATCPEPLGPYEYKLALLARGAENEFCYSLQAELDLRSAEALAASYRDDCVVSETISTAACGASGTDVTCGTLHQVCEFDPPSASGNAEGACSLDYGFLLCDYDAYLSRAQ